MNKYDIAIELLTNAFCLNWPDLFAAAESHDDIDKAIEVAPKITEIIDACENIDSSAGCFSANQERTAWKRFRRQHMEAKVAVQLEVASDGTR